MNKRRILLIDHTTIHSLLLHSIIKDEGYVCNLANNKDEAFSLLQENQYELVLLDVNQLDINGLELLKNLKSQIKYASVPVIAFSVKSDMQNIQRALQEGADDYLVKPFNIQDLVNKIANIMKSIY